MWGSECGRPSEDFAEELRNFLIKHRREGTETSDAYVVLVNEAAKPLIRITAVYSAANEAGKKAEEKAEAAEMKVREVVLEEFERKARKSAEEVVHKGVLIIPAEEARPFGDEAKAKGQPERMDGRQKSGDLAKVSFCLPVTTGLPL